MDWLPTHDFVMDGAPAVVRGWAQSQVSESRPGAPGFTQQQRLRFSNLRLRRKGLASHP